MPKNKSSGSNSERGSFQVSEFGLRFAWAWQRSAITAAANSAWIITRSNNATWQIQIQKHMQKQMQIYLCLLEMHSKARGEQLQLPTTTTRTLSDNGGTQWQSGLSDKLTLWQKCPKCDGQNSRLWHFWIVFQTLEKCVFKLNEW